MATDRGPLARGRLRAPGLLLLLPLLLALLLPHKLWAAGPPGAGETVFAPALEESDIYGPRIPEGHQGLWSVVVTAKLATDGSAEITEYWQAAYPHGTQHTEIYVPKRFGQLGFREDSLRLRMAAARDETGQALPYAQLNWRDFRSVGGQWNPQASFQNKAYRYGIRQTGDGTLELCFGLSELGQGQIYALSYRLDRAILRYPDGPAGNNLRFINDQLEPPPEFAQVILYMDQDLQTGEDTRIWGFGFPGLVGTREDKTGLLAGSHYHLLAQAQSGHFGRKNHITLLYQLDDPKFHVPESQGRKTWASVKQEAFKGSSYQQERRVNWFRYLASGGFFFLLSLLYGFFSPKASRGPGLIPLAGVSKHRYQKHPSSEPPFSGRLLPIYYCATQRSLTSRVPSDGQSYFSALLLDWIRQGAILPRVPFDARGRKAHLQTRLRIVGTPRSYDSEVAKNYWDMLCHIALEYGDAEGEFGAEEIKEHYRQIAKLQRAGQKQAKTPPDLQLPKLLNQEATGLMTKMHYAELRTRPYSQKLIPTPLGLEQLEQQLAFQDYVLNYSLHASREAYEAPVWDRILVAAAACGTAEQALKQMQKLVPEYQFAADTLADVTLDLNSFLYYLHHMGRISVYQAPTRTFGSSGFGGGSSLGGGGGFSGGFSGGGAR